jgi:hypothetical protein
MRVLSKSYVSNLILAYPFSSFGLESFNSFLE